MVDFGGRLVDGLVIGGVYDDDDAAMRNRMYHQRKHWRSVMWGFLASALGNVLGAQIGANNEQDALDAQQALANKQWMIGNRITSKRIQQARKYDTKMYRQSVRDARQNSLTDFQRNRQEARAARDFNEARREEVRQEGLADNEQQFKRLREAAEKAGYNPLSVLGMGQMTPAGAGLSTSAFAAAPSLTATPGAPQSGSTPMTYGAPIMPVASNDAVVGAVAELGRELTGVAAQERANEQFWQELAAREEERRAAVPAAARIAPSVPASGDYPSVSANRLPSMGKDAVSAGSVWMDGRAPDVWRADPWLPGGFPVERMPQQQWSPVSTMQVANREMPILTSSDGEVMGINELAGLGVQAAIAWPYSVYKEKGIGGFNPIPQVASVVREYTPMLYNWANKLPGPADDFQWPSGDTRFGTVRP